MKRIIILGMLILTTGLAAGCQRADVQTAAEGDPVGIENPMVEYPDMVSLQNEVGFMMIDFASDLGMVNRQYFVIGGTLAELLGEDSSGAAVSIRKAVGQEDISGYYDIRFEPGMAGYYEVFLGSNGDTSVGWWKDDIYTYSFAMKGGDTNDFTECLDVLVREAAFIRMLEAELPGGQALFRSMEELDKTLGYAALKLPETYQLFPAVIGIAAGGEGYIRYRESASNDHYIDIMTIQKEKHRFAVEDDIITAEQSVFDTPIAIGRGSGDAEGVRLCRWGNGGYSYAVVSYGQTEEGFDRMLEELVQITE